MGRYGLHTLLALEELAGIRPAMETVRAPGPVPSGGTFFPLRKMLAYETALHRARVIVVDPP